MKWSTPIRWWRPDPRRQGVALVDEVPGSRLSCSGTRALEVVGPSDAFAAPKSVVLSQFLIEAVVISMLGGVIGVLAGLVVVRFKIDGVQPVLATYSIPLAFGVALLVGVFAGLYPAYRAASLRPIDALRYE